MQKSLRLVWIGRIIQKSKWATVANYYFSKMGGLSFLLHCNFDVQHLPYIPPFYCEMLSWFQEIFPPNDIAKYVILNNKDIVINGKSLFWKSFYEKNIITISQLLIQNTNLMDLNDIRNHYGIEINFLKYYGLFSIIKRTFKDFKTHTFINTNFHVSKHGTLINTKSTKSKRFYIEYLKDRVQPPTCIPFWKNVSIDESIIYASMRFIRSATKESKLIAFHHKVVHNYAAHNANMKKWNMKETKLKRSNEHRTNLFCERRKQRKKDKKS